MTEKKKNKKEELKGVHSASSSTEDPNAHIPPPVVVFHTYRGEIHMGRLAACRKKCRWNTKKNEKTSLQLAQEIGSIGGKKATHGKTRHCKCGKRIARENKSGKCQACYTAWIKEKNDKALKSAVRKKTCKSCGKKLDHRNRSGYCRKHYSESTNFAEQVKQHSAFTVVSVFGKDVKTIQQEKDKLIG